jgi:hypothetical protein
MKREKTRRTQSILRSENLKTEEEEQAEFDDGFKFLGRPMMVQSREVCRTNEFLSLHER